MKRWLAWLLCAALLLPCVSLAEEDMIDLHVGRYIYSAAVFPEGDTIEDNVWTRYYRDALGVNLITDWTCTNTEYNDKLNIVIASSDIPDLVIECSYNQLQTMAEADMLMDLTDVLEEYGSDLLKSIYNGDGGAALEMCTFDGKLLALPYMTSVIYEPSLLWIRQDWLDNLGLEIPTTIEEVLAVAKAFDEQDPDQNGVDDTGGLAFSNYLFDGITSLTGFFNGYHAYPQIWIKQEDGTIGYGSVQPEMKDALARLAQLYQEGGIDPEFGVKDSAKVTEEVAGGKYGISYGRCWNIFQYGIAANEFPTMQWTPVPAPSADDQESLASVGVTYASFFAVNKNYEHPEAIIECANAYVDVLYGEHSSDPDYKYLTSQEVNGVMNDNTMFGLIRTLTSDEETIKALQIISDAVKNNDTSRLGELKAETGKAEAAIAYLYEGSQEDYQTYHQVKAFMTLAEDYPMERLVLNAFGGSTPTMAEKMGVLSNYENETFIKIIMGEEPVDTFDTFVEEWYRLGGEQILAEINAMVN